MNDDLIQPLAEGAGKDLVKEKIEELRLAVNELYRNPISMVSTDKGWPHVRKSLGWCYEIRNDGSYIVHCDTVHDKEKL